MTFKWLSANMVVSSFGIGALAIPIFQLGFVDSLLTIFFINLLGTLPVCFFSTFGPVFGLRQMVLSRFYFGYYGVKVIAIFNCLACVGWSAVNVIVGAQLINAVNSDVPGWAGIIIIAAATFFVTLFGYKVVHLYEFWSWIPSFVIFLITLGVFARTGDFINIPMGVGIGEAGNILSFAASVFGFATGWTSYAADYTCYQPVTVKRWSTFAWTWVGLMFPLCFTEMLGLAVATATTANAGVNDYNDGYFASGIGGLLGAVLIKNLGRFGEFCLVVLALSIVANNCPNIYSLTFSLQLLGRWTQAVPRFVWTFVGTLVYCAIAIPGYNSFVHVLENFMLLIGYWLAIYEGISIIDHVVFRRGTTGYEIATYNSPTLLPPGIAAIVAFCFGIMGAVVSLSCSWRH
jgi:NCS1 nucleoside transporter family